MRRNANWSSALNAGTNTSICVAVAVLLARLHAGNTSLQPQDGLSQSQGAQLCGPDVSKDAVRQRLAFVSAFCSAAQPTRTMLKQVFNYFQPRSETHRTPTAMH